MTALVRNELLRLRTTRSTWGLAVIGLVLTLGWAVVTLTGVGGVGAPARGSAELRGAMLGASSLGLFPILLLGVVAVTGEFHHATVTSTFLVTPVRWRVLVAKAVACALAASSVMVVFLAAAWTSGVVAGAVDAVPDAPLLEIAARSVLVAACWALLGVAVGAAVRNQTLAVILPLAWLLVIETLIPAYGMTWLLPWLPGGATTALSGGRFPGALPAWAALLVLMAYVVTLLVPGVRAITRRDVT
jgi:ABC-2 type transport system permease protein